VPFQKHAQTLKFKMMVHAFCVCLLLALTSTYTVVDGRQMCWSCQYGIGGYGEECTSNPKDWPGDPRVRCEGWCITQADFDKVTNKPTFFFRGCVRVAEFSYQKTGCYDNGARYHCFDICGEGEHYCNNASLPIFPGLPGSNTAYTV